MTAPIEAAAAPRLRPEFGVLFALGISHGLNDTMQSLMVAVYPLLKDELKLDYAQIGLISFVFQITASILQPFVGVYTDKRPLPYAQVFAMVFTFFGLLLLAGAHSFALVLVAAAIVGVGSSIFHPEAARIARLASGGKYGLAQSIFQVGGNAGSAIGPLLAALIVVPFGQSAIAWFCALAVLGMALLFHASRWYVDHLAAPRRSAAKAVTGDLSRGRIIGAVSILLALIFSKFFYLAAFNAFFTFYLIEKFALDVQGAQLALFAFLAAVAAGTFFGGPIGDRFGRLAVLWISFLGALPFALLVPYAGFWAAIVLSMIVGFLMASAFSAIVVYAQDLMPGRVGLVGGLFFGFAFGMGGLGAAALGWLADQTSIETVFRACAYLPVFGILILFLPRLRPKSVAAAG